MMLHITDLDELTQNIRNSYVKEYVTEALAAYRAGAYRAAVTTLWVAVCIDIIEKVRELSVSGDPQAKAIETRLDAIFPTDIKKMLEFENQLIDLASEDLELISLTETIHLDRLKEDRNFCVHPTFQKDGRHFNITAEGARNHIVNACTILFLHPPTKGKVFINQIFDRIADLSFPEDEEKAYVFLSSNNYLGRAKSSLKRNLIVILLKRLFVDTTKMDTPQVHRITGALKAIKRISEVDYRTAMREIFCRLLAQAGDPQFKRLFLLLKRDASCWDYLDEPAKIRISTVVNSSIADDIRKYQIPTAATSIDTLAKTLNKKIESMSTSDQLHIITTSPSPLFKELAIKHFTKSGSFETAYDRGGKILLPHAEFFQKTDISTLLEGALANREFAKKNQILNAGGIDSILASLFDKTWPRLKNSKAWKAFWDECKSQKYDLPELEKRLLLENIIVPVEDQSAEEEVPF